LGAGIVTTEVTVTVCGAGQITVWTEAEGLTVFVTTVVWDCGAGLLEDGAGFTDDESGLTEVETVFVEVEAGLLDDETGFMEDEAAA
jgi:hypothetical protein